MATKQMQEMQRHLATEKGDAIRRLFSTEDGKVLQRLLDEYIYGDIVEDTHDKTMMNLGAREVANRLRRLARLSEVVEQTGRST